MKLWHDDVRPNPEGWVWARTNNEAKRILETESVDEISLDHDLGYAGPPPGECQECYGTGLAFMDSDPADTQKFPCPACDGDGFIGGDVLYIAGTDDDDGRQLVKWMIETGNVPSKITIHSWNPAGAQHMAAMLREAGHDPEVLPYSLERFRQEAHLYGF